MAAHSAPRWPKSDELNIDAHDGQDGAWRPCCREQRQAFFATAARGRELARLLDSDAPVPGVTSAPLRPELAAIAVPSTTDGRNMAGDDFAMTAGWGRFGVGQAVMPGAGPRRRPRLHRRRAQGPNPGPFPSRAGESGWRPATAGQGRQSARQPAAPSLQGGGWG